MSNNKKILITLAALILGAALYFIPFKSSDVEVPSDEVTEAHLNHDHDHNLESIKEADIPKKAPVSPEENSNEDLTSELSNALKELPTLDDLKDLTADEVHHTPRIISEGGALIGELIDRAEKDPARREETVKFLKSCAEEEGVAPQLRAVCWNKTLNQISEWNVFIPISDANVPEEIKSLGNQL